MAIDDDEVARRQGTHDLARVFAQHGSEVLHRERERARRPIVLAREAERKRRQAPQVERIAGLRNDAPREPFRHDQIGVEWQVPAVLLDRPERQAKDRRLLETPRHVGRGKLSDRSAGRLRRHVSQRSWASAPISAPLRRPFRRVVGIGKRIQEVVIKLVPGARRLGGEVASVVGVDRALQRNPADDIDTRAGKAIELSRVIGEQANARASEHLQHARGSTIVALIIVEAKRGIGVERVEAGVLQL